MDFPESLQIPVGPAAKALFDWLKTFKAAFKAFGDACEGAIEGLTDILQWPPALVVVALFVALTWAIQRRWQPCVIVALGFLFVLNQGYWKETTETLSLVAFVCIICMAIGVPMGVAAAHRPRLFQAMQPVLDLMQTLPALVYLIPILILFGLGAAPALIVTIIFAMPAPVRMTYLGITSIPKPMIEAGEAFGATKRQLLWKVELPAAMPSIMAGLTQCIMLSLSMVVFATLIGAPSLGNPVFKALSNRNIPLGIEAGLAIVVLAIILDRMLAARTGAKK